MSNITKSEITSIVEEWQQIKDQIAELEKQRKDREAKIKSYLNQHRITEVEGAKLIEVSDTFIADTEKLKSEYSDIWEEVKKLKRGYTYIKKA